MRTFATSALTGSAWRMLLAALLVIGSFSCAAGDHLRILAWPGYADADLVAEFERQSGVRVEVSFINSDDELWSRISHNNGADYDVFAVNTAELQRYIDHKLVLPLDLRRIPNRAGQLHRFQQLDAISGVVRDREVYAIPYTYSEMGLIYNRKLVAQPPQSIGALWDPAYRGRVLAFNTSNHNFSIAALLMGAKNPFQLSARELTQAAKKLVMLRRNVRAFYGSPEEAVQLYLDNEIALVYANYGTQQLKALQQAGADVGYVIPREGALAWLDCWVLARGAERPQGQEQAQRWINFTLEKKVSDIFTARHGLANTVTPFPDSSSRDKIIWLQPLEDFARRTALWARILSGDRLDKF